jgi:hypothetical protein
VETIKNEETRFKGVEVIKDLRFDIKFSSSRGGYEGCCCVLLASDEAEVEVER